MTEPWPAFTQPKGPPHQECMNTTQSTHTLPATGVEVPAGMSDYWVGGYQFMPTATGIADTGRLWRGRVEVGLISQSGDGGPTVCHFKSRADREQFVADLAGASQESVLDDIMLETLALRGLAKSSVKATVVMPAGAETMDATLAIKPKLSAQTRGAYLAKYGPDARYWDGQRWAGLGG